MRRYARYEPLAEIRMYLRRIGRQDVCCTGAGKPAPSQHLPLFAFGSTYLALRGVQQLPRLRAKTQQRQEHP